MKIRELRYTAAGMPVFHEVPVAVAHALPTREGWVYDLYVGDVRVATIDAGPPGLGPRPFLEALRESPVFQQVVFEEEALYYVQGDDGYRIVHLVERRQLEEGELARATLPRVQKAVAALQAERQRELSRVVPSGALSYTLAANSLEAWLEWAEQLDEGARELLVYRLAVSRDALADSLRRRPSGEQGPAGE